MPRIYLKNKRDYEFKGIALCPKRFYLDEIKEGRSFYRDLSDLKTKFGVMVKLFKRIKYLH